MQEDWIYLSQKSVKRAYSAGSTWMVLVSVAGRVMFLQVTMLPVATEKLLIRHLPKAGKPFSTDHGGGKVSVSSRWWECMVYSDNSGFSRWENASSLTCWEILLLDKRYSYEQFDRSPVISMVRLIFFFKLNRKWLYCDSRQQDGKYIWKWGQ